MRRCRSSAWVSKCSDGRIDFANTSQSLCRLNGGVEHDFKLPDGCELRRGALTLRAKAQDMLCAGAVSLVLHFDGRKPLVE